MHRERFDRKYVVFEETYRRLSDEELEDMFAGKAKSFVKGPAITADNFAQAFYKRKTGAAFSKEMARSVKAMLEAYTGKTQQEQPGRKE